MSKYVVLPDAKSVQEIHWQTIVMHMQMKYAVEAAHRRRSGREENFLLDFKSAEAGREQRHD